MPDKKTLDANTEAESSDASIEPNDANASTTSVEESQSTEVKTTRDAVEAAFKVAEADIDEGVEDSDQENESEEEESKPEAEEEKPEAEEEEAEETENTDTDDDKNIEDDLPEEFHKNPRFKELIEQKNQLKEQVAERDETIKGYEPKVAMYDALGKDNVDQYAEFFVASQQDPQKALQLIQPVLQQLLVATGHTLPDHLQKQVESGDMTKEQAVDRSKLEAENANLRSANSTDRNQAEQDALKQNANALNDETVRWEKRMRNKDPDFQIIALSLKDRLTAALAEKGPPTLADLPKFLDEVYKEVKGRFAGTKSPKTGKRIVKGDTKKPTGKEQRVFTGKTSHEVTGNIVGAMLD